MGSHLGGIGDVLEDKMLDFSEMCKIYNIQKPKENNSFWRFAEVAGDFSRHC